MTTDTISDKVMLPSLSTILQEFAFQIETVVIRIRCTASGMDLHGSPRLDAGGTGVPPLGVSLCRIEAGRGCVALIIALGEKGDLPHPNCSGLCSSKVTKSS